MGSEAFLNGLLSIASLTFAAWSSAGPAACACTRYRAFGKCMTLDSSPPTPLPEGEGSVVRKGACQPLSVCSIGITRTLRFGNPNDNVCDQRENKKHQKDPGDSLQRLDDR